MRQNTYMDCSFRMSQAKMADVMYAMIMTHSRMVSTFTLSEKYTRKQNAYNNAWVKLHIEDKMIPLFEELSGLTLQKPEKISGAIGGAMV